MIGLIKKLKCPKTGKKLKLDSSGNFLEVENSDIQYPVYGRLINFNLEKAEKDFLLPESLQPDIDSLEKIMAEEGQTVAEKLNLPSEFRAILLDIPSGSDLAIVESYKKYKEADILVVDSDPLMLTRARQRMESMGIENAYFICCDLENLPFQDGVIGMAVSILGLNRAKQKEQVITEIRRVLRVSGTFSGAFYIQVNPAQQYLRQMGLSSEIFSSEKNIEKMMSDKFDFMNQELIKDKYIFETRKSWPSCGVKW